MWSAIAMQEDREKHDWECIEGFPSRSMIIEDNYCVQNKADEYVVKTLQNGANSSM